MKYSFSLLRMRNLVNIFILKYIILIWLNSVLFNNKNKKQHVIIKLCYKNLRNNVILYIFKYLRVYEIYFYRGKRYPASIIYNTDQYWFSFLSLDINIFFFNN